MSPRPEEASIERKTMSETSPRSSADLEKGADVVEPENDVVAATPQPVQNSEPQLLLDFDSKDDPGDPHNWNFKIKLWHAIVPGIASWLATLGTSIYTPGYREAAQDFNTSNVAALAGLSLYSLGLAWGPAIAAPLSEVFGRWIVYVATLICMSFFTLGAGFSTTLAAFLVTRFFAGALAGPVLSIGAGTIRDLFEPRQAAVASSVFIMAPFLGPVMGPIIGGFVVQYRNWRWSQWVVLFGAALALLCYATTRETYKKVILDRRAKDRGLGRPGTMTPAQRLKTTFTITILRPLQMIFTEAIVLALGLYTSFNFAVMFSFFAAFPLIFSQVYGFSTSEVGLTFLGLGFGVLMSVVTSITTDRLIYQKLHRALVAEGRPGLVAPEHRLYTAMFGSVGMPIGIFWFAWTARSDIHWISPVLASALFGWGNLCVFTSSALYHMDSYGALYGASAVAANGMMRYTLAAVFPLFIVQMYNRLGIGWASSLLGFISLALLPIPFVLFKWGLRIRQRSKYGTSTL